MVMIVIKGDVDSAQRECDVREIKATVLIQRLGGNIEDEVIVHAPDNMLERVAQWYDESRADEPPHRCGAMLYYSPL